MANLTALVTGASSGIGLAVVSHLLEENSGLSVVSCCRRPGPLEEHPRFTHWPTDLADPGTAEKRARRFCQEYPSCDLLLYAAGSGFFQPSPDWKAQSLQELVQLNLTSAMVLAGGLAQKLRTGRGLAVFLGSTSSRERAPVGAAYAATKSGLSTFSEYFFQENRKQGVRVMHLCPGMVSTPFYAQERFEPKDGEEYSVDLEALSHTIQFYFQGAGKNTNPTHLVLEPRMVGVKKKTLKND